MFNFLKSKTKNDHLQTTTLKLSGLHCTSCAANIDLALEDTPGVSSSDTSYQKSVAKITFDPEKTDLNSIKKVITNLGYQPE
ncbi:TPA: heavy metal transporter [Candidatus Collierbacteria bacterium]|uniref:Heavy metal translocating P-type ATPase n=1 Tax=Candidatus Collierbacteria bacterium GW2011_GWA2_42_17 TaxID=1618378 RepID=A0A0G1B9J6_9BACT|nr:MAG: Heavy metal translocating P-type ATPase [Candidatus Collierbacteria bacterium GW2011_GWB2_42_12]KKS43006.1 MAG: Heavy metal translocating P-type ATPase [Candidatus Collierbacteria bacterium GW2011_GWA2_42_17]KKS62536.1 MAG: Heavy metal translocating P-type ATPase [Candidatus Collierbacteria bacterium GW2011_GWE2_42_48]KKS62662.1 MAG: Heavy metal translocating P-type ATPase [Candidatus Collierbacteria bacterium GW2011_GWD2_42_50]KKS62969.1 MAG: Heavy metal translocating P-type ATPase [Ca